MGTTRNIRADGWTPARQLWFLMELSRSRSVTRAANAAGMSRESAYRLRKRPEGALFDVAWRGAKQGLISVNFGPRSSILRGLRSAAAARSTS